MVPRRAIWTLSRVVHGGWTATFNIHPPHLSASPNFIFYFCYSISSFPWRNLQPSVRRNHMQAATPCSASQLSYSTAESPAIVSLNAHGNGDDEMNEFLSRFVWIMRRKLIEFYGDLDKQTADSMLLLIVKKVVSEMEKSSGSDELVESNDFSEDLWKTVKEVSSMVVEEMQKAARKEKMKVFLQSEEVKDMYKFAWDAGVRGELLREMRFKWARENLEKHEAYQRFEKMKQEEEEEERKRTEEVDAEAIPIDSTIVVEENSGVSFPLRKGKLRYKIYGLDLSERIWADVADKIHETAETVWPAEAKDISGKSKLATEKILSLNEDDDPEAVLAEWTHLVQPRRVDWMVLLDRVKEKSPGLHSKVAEAVLNEGSYEGDVRDYSRLIDHHAKEGRAGDVERLLLKMGGAGLSPDVLILSLLIRMYGEAGEAGRAAQAFDVIRKRGFRPGEDVYRMMISAYVKAEDPRSALSLVREMEAGGVKVSEPVYLSVLRGFCRRGEANEAHRVATTMQFEGIPPSPESCALMVEAYGRAGDPAQARANLDHMRKIGFRPDDACVSAVVAAYERGNHLDKALQLLLELGRDGLDPGVATYSVLVRWLSRLILVEEVEQLLYRISELGEDPPFETNVCLCTMYARAGDEQKAVRALRALETRKENLGRRDFEQIISGFRAGGFGDHTETAVRLMEASGFKAPLDVKMSMAVLERARAFQKPVSGL